MGSFSRLAALLLLVFASCTKIDSTDIGGELIPPIDGINTFDTLLEVRSKMAGIDTIFVGSGEIHSLGQVNDPTFGSTNAQMNFEMRPSYYPYTFEKSRDSLFADSVVLVLQYTSAWGDTTSLVNLNVNEISTATPFKTDSVYTNVAGGNFQSAGALGSYSVNILRLRDSVKTFLDSGVGQIRIRLSGNNIADRLLRQFDTTNAYKSDSAFRTRFAGLQVTAGSGNALLKINLATSRLGIYYRYRQTSGTDTATVRYFGVTSTSGVANRIVRNRSAVVNAAIASTVTNQQLLYMETGPGTYADIDVPGLATFPKYAIHRAELICEQSITNPVTDGYFYEPALILTGTGDSARNFAVPYDFAFGATGIQNYNDYGGIPYRVTDGTGTFARYTFTLTRYLQNLVIGKLSPIRFRLLAPYNPVIYADRTGAYGARLYSSPVNNPAIGRVLLYGGAHPTRPMKLRIIYSKQ